VFPATEIAPVIQLLPLPVDFFSHVQSHANRVVAVILPEGARATEEPDFLAEVPD
jgi:hypothetical protein